MTKPKYIIYSYETGAYFASYLDGYTTVSKDAYRYSEEEILENIEDHQSWLTNCKLTQTYED